MTTTVPAPPRAEPPSQRQLDVPRGELVSRQPDWSDVGLWDDRKQILVPARDTRAPERRFAAEDWARPTPPPLRRIHEGMCRGAVGSRPITSDKRTRHSPATPDRLYKSQGARPTESTQKKRTTTHRARPTRPTGLTPRALSGKWHTCEEFMRTFQCSSLAAKRLDSSAWGKERSDAAPGRHGKGRIRRRR